MQLEGEIVRITYHNEGNGYTIAGLMHNKELTTVVGKFISINCGEFVRLNGEFVTNKVYGEQFAFNSYEKVYPSTTKGIISFLGSGLIKGVGEITAKNIVRMFQEETLNVIEFTPIRLAEVKGISKQKAMVIHDCFMEYKNVQNIIVFLAEYNISTNMALKIFEIYKNQTIPIIQENPYILVETIDGIGFLTADNIAKKLGIKKNSEFRIRAGVLYSLKTATERNGHTFLFKNELLKTVKTLLELEENIEQKFEDILTTLALEKMIVLTNLKGTDIVALEKLYRHEKVVSEKLSFLKNSIISTNNDVTKDIQHFEKINKITFHSEQILAISTALNNGVSVITGGPGTGKTTIIKCILSILETQGYNTLLLAPTGRAAKRMSETTGRDASTIHRALSMDFYTHKFFHDEQNPLDYDAVIIDEFSMVDISLAYFLIRALPKDCKLIIVGDKDQLPSVNAGNVLDDIIKSQTIKVVQLTQIFRQGSDSKIITNAHLINAGQMPELDNSSKDFFFETKENPLDVSSTIVGLVVKRLPNFLKVSPKQIQVLAPLKSGACGVVSLNTKLQQELNPASLNKKSIMVGSNVFREGDKVMQLVNNYSLEYKQYLGNNRVIESAGIFNGDMGYITEINVETGEMRVMFDGSREALYPRTELHQLSLAYAITIHKSQGSEFDVVVIPAISGPYMIFNRNLIYTAVTRAKKMVVLVGDKRHLRTMIKNKFILQRNTLLCEFLKKSDKKTKELFEIE